MIDGRTVMEVDPEGRSAAEVTALWKYISDRLEKNFRRTVFAAPDGTPRQVVLPVRQAASIAQRFANGHLKERMVIRGEDDVARLAMAFNDMAQSLSDQITQLEEFGDLQKRFTSDVSHELRTPLTTVRMAADIISDSAADLDAPAKRAVELLESAAEV